MGLKTALTAPAEMRKSGESYGAIAAYLVIVTGVLACQGIGWVLLKLGIHDDGPIDGRRAEDFRNTS